VLMAHSWSAQIFGEKQWEFEVSGCVFERCFRPILGVFCRVF
jgi:hypothetical protein